MVLSLRFVVSGTEGVEICVFRYVLFWRVFWVLMRDWDWDWEILVWMRWVSNVVFCLDFAGG